MMVSLAIPKFEKLPLECALDDPPQLRTLTSVFSSDVTAQHEYLATLHRLASKLVNSLDDVTLAYQSLAHHMNGYSSKVYAINTDPQKLIETSLSKCAELMQEVSSWQHILCTQLTDGVLHPLTQQLNAYSQLQQLKEKHAQCTLQLDSAMSSFLRVKKKDADAEKEQAALFLTDTRRNFHQCSVLYYNELNLHQSGRVLSFLTPLLAMVAAHQCFHSLAHSALNSSHNKRQVQLLKEVMKAKSLEKEKTAEEEGEESKEEKHEKEPMETTAAKKSSNESERVRIPKKNDDDYFEAMGLVTKRLENEHEKESTACSDLIGALLDHSEQLYSPSTASTVHAHQAHTHGLHGYLNVNRKFMAGVMSTWERLYVFVEGGYLMSVGRNEVAATPLMALDKDTICHAADVDDRMHVLSVITAKKSLTLQALTDAERDIWMSGLEKAGRDGASGRGSSSGGLGTPVVPPSPGGSGGSLSSVSGATAAAALLSGAVPSTGFLSSMGQFLTSKFQAVNIASNSGTSSTPVYSCPKPSKLSPLKEKDTRSIFGGGGAISQNAPIVFDLGPAQSTPEAKIEYAKGQNFDASFLGSMPVNVATSASTVIGEVIRRVMSARAHHNLFSSTPVVITICSPHINVSARHEVEDGFRQRHKLTALTGWCTHQENPRLFGYVVRGISNLQCFVFQCDDDSSRICRAITIADDPHAREKEKSLIFANIAQLEDDPYGLKTKEELEKKKLKAELEDEEKVLEEFDGLTEEQIAEMEAEMGITL